MCNQTASEHLFSLARSSFLLFSISIHLDPSVRFSRSLVHSFSFSLSPISLHPTFLCLSPSLLSYMSRSLFTVFSASPRSVFLAEYQIPTIWVGGYFVESTWLGLTELGDRVPRLPSCRDSGRLLLPPPPPPAEDTAAPRRAAPRSHRLAS